MPTIPKAGFVRTEDNPDITSNSRIYLPSPSDRSDNETKDDKTRRKLRKAQTESNKIARRPTTGGGPVNSNPQDVQAPIPRKLSVRTQKAPMGARPLTRSPSKTTATDASAKSRSTSFSSNLVPATRQAPSTNMPKLQLGSSHNSTSQAKEDGSTAPFLPEVNFDDLHSSITADLNLYDLAAADDSSDRHIQVKNHPPMSNGIKAFYGGTGEKKDGESRVSRNNSLQKRQLEFGARNPQATSKNPALIAANTSAARARRQSHFPTSTTTNSLPRVPRKSIGPGVLTQSSSEHTFLRRGSAAFANTTQPTSSIPSNIDAVSNSFLVSRSPTSGSEEFPSTSVRANRAKPSQASRKSGLDLLSATYDGADQSTSNSRSPLRHSTVGTPGSNASSKRLSMMPGGHATGLGARTISPTDAHRMRRMSMMPNAPPVPQTPPIATPEIHTADFKAAFDAVSQVPRKSDTPSSNRTTPDPNRKSITSIVSATSITSLSSARGPVMAAGRNNSGGSISRLPTLKGRSEATSTEAGELVPPVPAIPKAYESPKNEVDISFQYPPRKPSLQFDASRSASVSTADFTSAASTYSSDKETPKAAKEERKHVKMSVFPSIDPVERASGAQDGRRTLQPIKLPPLNPLSLRTPTNEQIASLAAESSADGTPPSTPPAKKFSAKVPSTPMTASRTTFFSRKIAKEESNVLPPHLRSSSSYYQLRSDGQYGDSNYSSQLVEPIELHPPRKNVSPFTSASLPKDQKEFESMQAKSTERDLMGSATEPRLNRLTGPRAQMSKITKAEALDTSGAFTDTERNSFGNALRRKLSLTRRRSSSKIEGERPPQPPDHEIMPPPRLPASTTWNNINQKSASPTIKSSYLQSRRKSVHVDALAKDRRAGDVRGLEGTRDSIGFSISGSFGPNSSNRAVSSSIPAAPRMYNMSHQPMRLPISDMVMDSDDLEAEEEMKKLASKRKRTEIEARELDDLRKRAVPREGVTAMQALRAARLNLFERGEIVDYKSIHFCGTQSAQKLEGNAEVVSTNFGYDDERGDYNIVMGDHLAYRYEVVDVLGKGSFGQVVRCVDHKTGGLVAIKIIRNKKRFHQQALVEVDILQKLREWDPESKFSMVSFTAHFYFRGHLCISTELLGINLYEFIKLHDFKGFSLKLIRRFTKQILNSLLLLQSHQIIHCDLKPENILLAHPAQSEIKVIDFGSSCHENERVYTYIQSRFYRSPEVILGMTYGMPIDMWSVGCILAELLTGYPIFPGENEQEQLACIMEIFGPPDKSLIEKATRKKLFFDSLGKPRLTVSSKGKRRRPSSRTLQQALKCDDEPFLDFLTKCLRWDPERRLKPDEAMVHEFITGMKMPPPRSTKGMQQSAISSSPMKRFNSVHVSTNTRPLPDPPNLSLKNSITTGRIREPAISPSKSFTRRYSTAINVPNGVISTRKASGTLSKTMSGPGRTDLASAAAAAATTRTR